MADAADITALLTRAGAGERHAFDALLPQVYERLRRLAHRQLVGESAHTLSTTALVHEAWLGMVQQRELAFADRAHFLGYAATAMRHILVDHARRKAAQKRGGGQRLLDWQAHDVPVEDLAADLLCLDEALGELAGVDARLARVVELRFFGGLSVEETGELLGITARSVVRDWRKARAFLHQTLQSPT